MKRIEWIDTLKGAGIIFVIFAHLSPNILIETHIYSFHMFLFFFLSGYLFKDKVSESLNFFFKRRVKRLIIPFFIWNTLAILLELVLNPSYEFKNVLVDFFFLDGKISWNAPIWFLVVLFEVEILYKIIHKNKNNIVRFIIIVIIFVIGIFTQNTLLPFGLSIVPIATSFYFLGNMTNKIKLISKVSRTSKIKLVIIMFFLLMLNIIFSIVLNERISVYNSDYGNYLFTYIAGISGILFYVFLFAKIGKIKLLEYFGKNTLIILSTQYFLFRIFNVISKPFVDVDINVWYYRSTIKALIITVIVLIIYHIIFRVLSHSKNVVIVKFNNLIGLVE